MAAPHFLPQDAPALRAAKQAARRVACAARAGCRPEWGRAMARHLLRDAPPPPGAIIGGFWPLAEEIDLVPLLHLLHRRGHVVLLPDTPQPGKALSFRLWHPDAPLLAGRFGTQTTDGPIMQPDLVLVPLLAFDRAGRRLGYGGGYYDRSFAQWPAMARIGCAFAAQELDEVPAGAYDARLPCVATERGVIRCEG